ncbi:MAG: hypothetical protein GYB35_01000 [Algicola sp.]|nr:hypothetical protein [Algicola sp.]
MSTLLPNLPIEDLTRDNDFLGIIDKGEIIKTLLENNTKEFEKIKMFSLYGDWGSGKSTLMKYLEKELKSDFNTFFFEAWQYESDDNLSLSLLEFLTYETKDSTEETLDEIVKVAAKLFRGFSKSLRITVPGLSIDGNKIVESLEEKPQDTFYQLKSKFENEFVKWESNVTKENQPNFNIVFIDDLDRCEPENVLNLLSALKLFFTYGEKTIFFCGVDKKAVREAVKTKYGEVVKANEYLEKVFDISFSMPDHNNLYMLIKHYFNDSELNFLEGKLVENISSFFIHLNFKNPRRIKKVLNKYLLLVNISKELNNEISSLNLFGSTAEETGNYFETILSLYLIILYEFHPALVDNVFDLKYKEAMLVSVIKETVNEQSQEAYRNTIEQYVDDNILNKKLNEIYYDSAQFDQLIFTFLPNNIKELKSNSYSLSAFSKIKISDKKIDYWFLNYLLNNDKMFLERKLFTDLTLLEIKQLIKNIL